MKEKVGRRDGYIKINIYLRINPFVKIFPDAFKNDRLEL